MKRIGKILLSAVLVLALCLCLCSCAALDELRAARAELRKDANGEEVIVFQDSVYRSVASLAPGGWTRLHVSFYGGMAYVADPDVPTLLLSEYGTSCPCSEDASIIRYLDDYYVREDRLDDLRALLEKKGQSCYCLESRYETETTHFPMVPDGYTEVLDRLTALADAGDHALPEASGDVYYVFTDTFYRCDANASFLTAQYSFVRLSEDGSGTDPAKETYIYNWDTDRVARVPEEDLPAVDRMIEQFDMLDSYRW
ncbi:MAG: hypothetical protein IK082_11685 [Oscillospiraceae bacterium]|nr:hypothetical protein [Oscillospiraceae bacterium]